MKACTVLSASRAMTSSPVVAEASWPSCMASWVSWYCSVSVASITADLAPDCDSTSFVRMSTRSCKRRDQILLRRDGVRRACRARRVFCVCCASNEATLAASWPRSAASTRSSRSRSAGRMSSGQAIGGAARTRARAAAASAARAAQALGLGRGEAGARGRVTSASAAERSSSTSMSPAFTRAPLATWIAGDPAGLDGLDHLDASGRLEFALRRRR